MTKKRPDLFLIVCCVSVLVHAGVLFFTRQPDRRETTRQVSRFVLLNLSRPAPSAPALARPRPLPPSALAESAVPVPPPLPPDPDFSPPEEMQTGENFADGIPLADASEADIHGAYSDVPYVSPARDDLLAQYLAVVRSLIDKRKEYPYEARRQEQEGTVEVRFVVSRDGLLAGEPELGRKTRYSKINASALEAVKRAAPYPSFPDEIQDETINLSVTVAFSLR
jgi:protein TonB